MAFDAVETVLNLPDLEKELLAKWQQENLFEKSLKMREGSPAWVFYEGPPTANGVPGIHHVWARVFKDLYPRFWSMRGRYVPRQAGWDCHGLPVEIEVEKELGFTAKAQIEEYGIQAFNEKCRESVQRYVDDWKSLTERIGMWIDTENAYWTMSNEFIESVWWIFSEMWNKDLIYEGSKVVPYCGRCGTALSSHEVAQGYKDVTEESAYVRFQMRELPYDLVAWTTTPWTLISNVALGVNPKVKYVEVKSPAESPEGRNLVLAEARVQSILGESVEIVREVEASELVGQYYEQPLTYLEQHLNPEGGDAFRVLSADFVSVDEGSGIVHLASSFGEIDRQVCEENGIATLNPVNVEGKFMDLVGEHSQKFVMDANPGILSELGDAVLDVEPYRHSYPFCWRCDTPLIYWAKPTWFAATSKKREQLLKENSKVGWYPPHIKDGRFGTWLEENVDWALSRDRFWGTPVPIWRCQDCGRTHCVGSLAELSELSGTDLQEMDLHRPFIDEVVFPCMKAAMLVGTKVDKSCNGTFHREPSVLDAWFDSGSMPLAQFHYPFAKNAPSKKKAQSQEEIKAERFPADFICEAIDQTRGWFYSLLAVNTLAFGQTPYKNVVCLSHIVDKHGIKMSKSRGNIMAPQPPIEELGADSLRWYFLAESPPWTPRRMSLEEVARSTRQTLMTFWNVYSFFVTYANIDNWSVGDADPADATHSMDLWLRSRLATTLKAVTSALENFDAYSAAQSIKTFVDDMSNWYVRRSRARFWKGDDLMAHAVLYEALVGAAQMLAPFCPFLADSIYRNLCGGESVHLSDWPELEAQNAELERDTAIVRKLAALGRSARSEAGIKVRKPLKRALVVFPSGGLRGSEAVLSKEAVPSKETVLSKEALQDLADELNVKSVEHAPDLEELFTYEVRPNFKSLGPRLGEKVNAAAKLIKELDGQELKTTFSSAGQYGLEVNGEVIQLHPDDLEITAVSHENLAVSEDSGFSIALDLELTQELLEEGVVRELIRSVNEHRKNTGLDIADRISLEISSTDWIYTAVKASSKKLAEEVLATEIEIFDRAPEGDMVVSLTDDGHKAGIRIKLSTNG